MMWNLILIIIFFASPSWSQFSLFQPQNSRLNCYMPPCPPLQNRNCPTCFDSRATSWPIPSSVQQPLWFQQPHWFPFYQNHFNPWAGFWGGHVQQPYYPTPRYPNVGPGPRPGDMVAYKPVIYVADGDGKKFSLRFDFQQRGQILSSVPALSKNLIWETEIKNNRFVVEGVSYDYLFYDTITSSVGIQQTRGFCGDRAKVLREMKQGLVDSGFPATSVREFETHWHIKLPPSEDYCVYPQTNEHLESTQKIHFTPKPALYSRIQYYVAPKEHFDSLKRRPATTAKVLLPLTQRPNQLFVFKKQDPRPVKGAKFYDWGVGFIVANDEKDVKNSP